MGDVIGPVILGIIISILGISNMKGNISSLHWYHRQRVSPDDVMPFGKRVGLGTLIIGIAIIVFGLFSLITYLTEIEVYRCSAFDSCGDCRAWPKPVCDHQV